MNPAIDPTVARLEQELKHTRGLIGCRFDSTGRFLFVSSEDDLIHRYDLLGGAPTPLVGHKSWVRGMAFIGPDAAGSAELEAWGQRRRSLHAVAGFAGETLPIPKPAPFVLVSGDYHGNLIWWQAELPEPKPIRTVEAHKGWVRAVTTSADGKTIASCGNDNLVKLWNAQTGAFIRNLEGHTSAVYNVAFHPDGNRLASCDLKGVVKDWNWKTGTAERELDAKVLTKFDPTFMADIGGARAIRFTPDGSRLGCAGIVNVTNAFAGVGNPAVVMFDWKAGTSKLLKTKEAFQGTAWGFAFHPEGFSIIAAGGSGGRVWFANPDEATTFHMLTVPIGVRDMDIAPAGNRFACAGANGTVYIYTFTPGATPAKPAPAKKK